MFPVKVELREFYFLSILLIISANSISNQCPQQCHCLTETEIHTLICSEFPETIPKQVTYFTVKNTMISSLRENQMKMLTHVEVLKLPYLEIEVIEDGTFLQMKQLEILNLANNRIKKITNQTFAQCVKLIEIRLEKNSIKVIESGAFEHLINLQRLYISNNNLLNLPTILPSSLMEIYANNNFLKTLPKISNKLDQLRKFDLCGNDFDAFESENFKTPHLHHLCLGDKVQVLNFENLKDTELHTLEIRSKNIPWMMILSELQDLNGLKNLSLSDINLSDPFNNTFNLNELTVLQLHQVSVDNKLALQLFQGTPKLKVLNLFNSPALVRAVLNDISILDHLVNVKKLILAETSITTLTAELLKKLPALRELDVSSNPLHCDCNLEWIVRKNRGNEFNLLSPDNTICNSPNNLQNYKFLSRTVQLSLCSDRQTHKVSMVDVDNSEVDNSQNENNTNTYKTTDIYDSTDNYNTTDTYNTTNPTTTLNTSLVTMKHILYAVICFSVLILLLVIAIIVILCIRCREHKEEQISYRRNPSIDLLPIRPTSLAFYGEDSDNEFDYSTLKFDANDPLDDEFYTKTTVTFQKKKSQKS